MTTARRRTSGRGSRSFRARGSRRTNFWVDELINFTNPGALNQDAFSIITQLTDEHRKGATLQRLIISLTLFAVQVGVGQVLTMGIGQVTDDALAAGSVPDPAQQADDAAWSWKGVFPVSTDSVNDFSQARKIDVDLHGRARLRARDNDFILVTDSGASTIDTNVDGIIRSLWLIN